MFDSGSKGLVVEPYRDMCFCEQFGQAGAATSHTSSYQNCTISDYCQYKFDTGQYDADPTQSSELYVFKGTCNDYSLTVVTNQQTIVLTKSCKTFTFKHRLE